eukprot:CAMPEP_0118969298 /NCGR_PEP_ID=MMETSP1173-20130426/6409_1 /TAXON_ID=1034831 /ORGANISM="Rhizochromulina marina cf, Strain CCMP1243" /LENGTH=126 /DNA_ID=CAMNT_0006918521 /DNA_START=363 /DNA_END=743 /DNA_ORIENTATION=-
MYSFMQCSINPCTCWTSSQGTTRDPAVSGGTAPDATIPTPPPSSAAAAGRAGGSEAPPAAATGAGGRRSSRSPVGKDKGTSPGTGGAGNACAPAASGGIDDMVSGRGTGVEAGARRALVPSPSTSL